MRKVHSLVVRSAILVVALFICAVASAETIRGVVVDASGAVISGAKVEVMHGSMSKSASSAADGTFAIDVPGAIATGWKVRVSAVGFADVEVAIPGSGQVTVQLRAKDAGQVIAVSARRSEAAVNETAESLTLMDAQMLRQSGSFVLDNQLRQAPGFNLFRRSDSLSANPTSQGVSFRGIGASGASRTLVLNDGVPLNDPFGGWVYWDRVPRAAMEHVELLQGGASELYGSTALSGVIEVFPQKPANEWLVLESSGGTRTTPEGSAFLGKDFGKWTLSGSGGGYSTDGFIATPNSVRGLVDRPVASRDSNAMASIGRTYSSGSIDLSGMYFHESRDNGTPIQTNDTNIGEGDARWTQSFKGGVLSGTLFGSGQSYNQSFSSVAANRNSESLTRLQHVPAQRIGGGLQWSNSAARRQQWTFGGDAQNVRGFSLEEGFAAGNATVKTSAGGTQHSFGFFAQDTIRAGTRLIFGLGARVDHWANVNATSASKSLSTGVVTATPFADKDYNFVSPHASMLVRLNDALALTFAGSRAFRAPTLNELYRSFRLGNVLTNANDALRAEQLYGGEGGLVANVQRVRFRATGFAYQVLDPVANVTLSSTPALITRQRQNLGETASRGLELSAGSENFSHLSWNVGYQYTHATVQDFPADLSLVGKRVPQVPAHAFTFQAAWNAREWSVSAQGRASGNQFDDDQNAFALGRAFSLDAMLSKHFSRGVTVFVAGTNLTNDRELTALTPNPQIGAGIGGRVGVRVALPQRDIHD